MTTRLRSTPVFLAGRDAASPDLIADLCPLCTGEREIPDPDVDDTHARVTCPACLGSGRRGWRSSDGPPPIGS